MHSDSDPDSDFEDSTVIETTAKQVLTGYQVGYYHTRPKCLHCERPLCEGELVYVLAHRRPRTPRFEAVVAACQECGPHTRRDDLAIIHAEAILAVVSHPQRAVHQYCLRDVSITHSGTHSSGASSTNPGQA